VRLWDVTVPAGDATLWHAHRSDNVVVSFGDVRLRIETLGRDPVEGPWKFGEVRFSKATYIHRAMNVGTTSFHNFTIELLKMPGGATLKKEPGRDPVLDNERVRVFRVALDPGQSGPMHTHAVPILAIALTSAELEVTTEGRGPTRARQKARGQRALALRAGHPCNQERRYDAVRRRRHRTQIVLVAQTSVCGGLVQSRFGIRSKSTLGARAPRPHTCA
jgi:quercetin dioxygenase-like cupin family protein